MTEYDNSGGSEELTQAPEVGLAQISLDDLLAEELAVEVIEAIDAVILSDDVAESRPSWRIPFGGGSPQDVVQAVSLDWIRALNSISAPLNEGAGLRGSSPGDTVQAISLDWIRALNSISAPLNEGAGLRGSSPGDTVQAISLDWTRILNSISVPLNEGTGLQECSPGGTVQVVSLDWIRLLDGIRVPLGGDQPIATGGWGINSLTGPEEICVATALLILGSGEAFPNISMLGIRP